MIFGEDIKRLIPQRYPMLMVDELEVRDATTAVTALTVRTDNYFMLRDGTLSATGLIEHMAQSCSALAAWNRDVLTTAAAPPVGLIGEVKHFECERRVCSGEKVSTVVTFGLSFAGATLAQAESRVGEAVVARAKLKIFMQE